MTVAELIEHLQQFPQDAEVIRTFCSDYETVEPNQITLLSKDLPPPTRYGEPEPDRVVLRNGNYMRYYPSHWPKNETPNFATVVHFEGN